MCSKRKNSAAAASSIPSFRSSTSATVCTTPSTLANPTKAYFVQMQDNDVASCELGIQLAASMRAKLSSTPNSAGEIGGKKCSIHVQSMISRVNRSRFEISMSTPTSLSSVLPTSATLFGVTKSSRRSWTVCSGATTFRGLSSVRFV